MLLWGLGSCLATVSVNAKEAELIMPTTSQILGLTPQEKAAAIFTAAGEAGPGKDALGVLQTILTRKASSGGNIANLVKAPQQFVANDPYSLKQVVDPAYGRRLYGSRYAQIERMLEDPSQMASALDTARGATQFRGQALLSKRQKGDVMFDPKGNFYFQQNPGLAKTLSERLLRGYSSKPQKVSSEPGGRTFIVSDEEEADKGSLFLEKFIRMKQPAMPQGLDVASIFLNSALNQETPNYLGDIG